MINKSGRFHGICGESIWKYIWSILKEIGQLSNGTCFIGLGSFDPWRSLNCPVSTLHSLPLLVSISDRGVLSASSSAALRASLRCYSLGHAIQHRVNPVPALITLILPGDASGPAIAPHVCFPFRESTYWRNHLRQYITFKTLKHLVEPLPCRCFVALQM